MSYILKREDVFGLAGAMNAETMEKGDELFWRRCPYCNGGGSDQYTFSVNLRSGAFKCFRASCDAHGHFVEMARDFGYRLDFDEPRVYRKLKQPKKPIQPKDGAIDYLAKRGISREVAERYEITVRDDQPNVMVFPFYDEQGVLQFVKYRNMAFKKGGNGSKEWCEPGTMPILFGMKQCKDFGRLVITEGQLDSLSVAEAGIENAVSVPTGATGFTWWNPCREWLEQFEEIVVFGDHEHGIITLVDGIRARYDGIVKVVRVVDYLGEKDANDILTHYGPAAVRKAVERAEIPKIENVKDLASVRQIDPADLDKIKTGIREIDKAIGGLCMGQVVLLTGRRGEGKSTLMSQIFCEALDQGETAFAYSGELADFHFRRWVDYQLAGSANMTVDEDEYGNPVYRVTDDAMRRISEWYRGRAFLYDNDYIPNGETEMESLPRTVERVIRQYNARLICIDNLMTAMDRVNDQNNLYLAQSNFVGELKKIAMRFQVVILLVAHPRKTLTADLGNDDVSGSSDITNKVDVVLTYQRAKPDDDADGLVQITKNRLYGRLVVGKNAIKLRYSEKTKRIFSDSETAPKVYGWEKYREQAEPDSALPFK